MQTSYGLTFFAKEMVSGQLAKMERAGASASRTLDKGQDTFQVELRESAREVNRLKGGLLGLKAPLGGLGRLATGIFAGFSIFRLATVSLRNYDRQARSVAKVNQLIETTGGAAGLSLEVLTKEASRLQRATPGMFGDEKILDESTAQLLTFTRITGLNFLRAQRAAIDLSAVLAKSNNSEPDLKSASLQLGKALEDPVRGLSMLSRAGVTFTEKQMKVIKRLAKTNQLSKAQSLILREIESKYDGVSDAAGRAGIEGLRDLNGLMSDLTEKIGGGLYMVINDLLPLANSFVSFLERSIEELGKNKELVYGFAGALGAAAAAVAVLKVGMLGLNLIMAANPIGGVIAGLSALVGAVVYAWNKFEGFRGFLFGLWDSIKTVFSRIREAVIDVFGGIGKILKGVFTLDLKLIQEGLKQQLKGGINLSPIVHAKEIGESFRLGRARGINDFRFSKLAAKDRLNSEGGSFIPPGGGSGSGSGSNLDAGIAGVTSDAKAARNITLNINQLIGSLEFHTEQLEESTERIRDVVMQTLTSTLRDGTVIAGG